MRKRWLAASITTLLLSSVGTSRIQPVHAEDTLNELQEEQEKIEDRSHEVEDDIEQQESELKALDSERAALESQIQSLQLELDKLMSGLEKQSLRLEETNAEIVMLQSEIDELNLAIEKRNHKLETQARATQTEWNASNIIHTILAAEDFAEVMSRLGVVSQLVKANQQIVEDQIRDQKAIIKAEAQMQFEKEAVTELLIEMESTRGEMAAQQEELDSQIAHVADLYQMTAAEKEAFVQEQYLLAKKYETVESQIETEKDRILAEQQAEQERIAQLTAEKEAAEQREQEASARKAAEEAAAAEKAVENEVEPSSSDNQIDEAEESVSENQPNEQPVEEPAVPDTDPELATDPVKEQPAEEEPEEETVKPETPSATFIRPASGYISSGFGMRNHPVTGERKMHNGIDIAGEGAILAAASGTVTISSYSSSYGFYIKIDHGNGFETLYAHLQPGVSVTAGQSVSQGQRIAVMGTTGLSTGVHLHFEVRKNGSFVDPALYI